MTVVSAEQDVQVLPLVRLAPVIRRAIADHVLRTVNAQEIVVSETIAKGVGLHPIVHEVCSVIMATVSALLTLISTVETVSKTSEKSVTTETE